MRDYVVYLQEAKEKEHAVLAAKIHDKIAQNLLALRIDIAMLHGRTQNTHPHINHKAEGLLREIDVAIQNTKDIIRQLHSPVFALGLIASIDWTIKEFNRTGAAHGALHVLSKEEAFDRYNRHTIPVIRMLHEALRNAVQHRQAQSITVTVSAKKSALHIDITDDGTGIQPEDVNKHQAFGLIWIREYTRRQNGRFSITAPPSGGAHLSLFLPGHAADSAKGIMPDDALL